MSGAIILAGGGSGGHLSPGLAVAERLHASHPDRTIIFACSRRPTDRMMLESAGARFEPITSSAFTFRPLRVLPMIRSLVRGAREADRLLERSQAAVVLAMGGYVTVPVVHAARRRGLRVVLLNLDAVPGRANRWIAGRADEICTTVPIRDSSSMETASEIGFPIRRSAMAASDSLSCRERLGLDPSRPTLLVTGASQGASSLNAFMRELVGGTPLALDGWQVIHLTGPNDEKQLARAYAAAGIPSAVTGFLDHMGLAWGAADLALSRAGANSVAEAAVNHVPTLFVPYPHHKDLHQKYNAEPLVRIGAAELAHDSIQPGPNMTTIGEPLIALLTDPERLGRMRQALESRSPRDGAREIADRLVVED